MTGARWALLLALAGAAGSAALLLGRPCACPSETGVSPAADRPESRSTAVEAPIPVPPVPRPPEADAAPASLEAQVSFVDRLRAYRDLRIAAKRSPGAGDGTRTPSPRGEEDEDPLESARTALIEALRREPALSAVLWSEIEEAERDDALALARILRFSKAEGLGTRLARRITDAEDAVDREAALVAVEGRPAEVWLDAVARAFAADAAPPVRERASHVLGHALADRQNLARRADVRAPLLAGLGASDAKQRARAALALGFDVHVSPGEEAPLRRLESEDPDRDVRAAAQAALRMLSSRLDANAPKPTSR